jgi:hypothetical protein
MKVRIGAPRSGLTKCRKNPPTFAGSAHQKRTHTAQIDQISNDDQHNQATSGTYSTARIYQKPLA